jgi:hypothetical protein
MEGIDKPHTGKYKEITNDLNYDASCTLTSLPVWYLNFKRLIFVYRVYLGSFVPWVISYCSAVNGQVCKTLLPNLIFVHHEQCVLVSSSGVRLFTVYSALKFLTINVLFQEVSCVFFVWECFYFL